VLLPLLRSLGVRRLGILMLSHRDSDHVGGAATLLQALPVGELRSSLEPGHPLLRVGPAEVRCEAGQGWTWDGVRFDMLHPTAPHFEAGLKSNNLSCVLLITSAATGSGRRALLAGDLEAEQERALVKRHSGMPGDLRADVLLVPHHGSKTSSSAELLAAVRPATALVQAGYRSRFGHPAPVVLARYQAAGAVVVASPACGAWRWRSDAATADGLCERDRRRRYWQDHGPASSGPEGPPADEAAPADKELAF
jgi:competence protein ComEC